MAEVRDINLSGDFPTMERFASAMAREGAVPQDLLRIRELLESEAQVGRRSQDIRDSFAIAERVLALYARARRFE